MNCTTCGNQLNDNAKFCTVCGSPVIGQSTMTGSVHNNCASNMQQPVYSPNAAFYQQPNYPPYPSQQAPRKGNTKVIILCVIIGILVIFTSVLGYSVYENETESTWDKFEDAGDSFMDDIFGEDD